MILEQDEDNAISETNNFTSCSPVEPTSSGSSYMQRTNYSKRCNRKSFSEKNKKYRIGTNGQRMKDDNNDHLFDEEDPFKRAKQKHSSLRSMICRKHHILRIGSRHSWTIK